MKAMSAIRNSLGDSLLMSGRILRHSTRSLDTMITVVAMPMMMMLMFVYVFGGAIDTGAVEYIDYIVPGIILMCIASAVAYTAFRLNNDVTKGIVERFRSMPIAGSSILAGHVLSSLVFNAVSVLLILLFAFLLGLRTEVGIIGWLSIAGILLLCILALTWIAVLFGLLAKSAEGASVFSYLVLGLLFTSSSFVPTDTMPRGLQGIRGEPADDADHRDASRPDAAPAGGKERSRCRSVVRRNSRPFLYRCNEDLQAEEGEVALAVHATYRRPAEPGRAIHWVCLDLPS